MLLVLGWVATRVFNKLVEVFSNLRTKVVLNGEKYNSK